MKKKKWENSLKYRSLCDVYGKLENPSSITGLVREIEVVCWNKPFNELTNQQMITLLQQDLAVSYILPLAQQRIIDKYNDDTEIYPGLFKKTVNEISQKVNKKNGLSS